MGVPWFYRWLTNKYPTVVVKAAEDKGERIDTSLPNPNGIEFDNLYLDMNAIIHFSFQPADQPRPPKTFEEVFNNIFKYVDNLFSIVKPRKLLYMAIDGVAPWAKMNQQRSGRFRTIWRCERDEAEMKRLIEQFEMEGKPVLREYLLPNNDKQEVSTSHVITPGTEFMYKLSGALRSYVISRINNDPGWRDIKVIFSDANVPGEGEHKIMSFIRQQKNVSVGYNPNTRHCVYGLDADLIMLALATHEVHFSILREEHPTINESEEEEEREWFKKPYEFVHVWILRKYLELDMHISEPPANVKIDIERIVDDFIFLCFFLGNDFLPGMPSLEVREGAIDLLMSVYKTEFKNLGGYLLDMSRLVEEDQRKEFINLSRVEKFILLVGSYEDQVFRKRSKIREHQLRRLRKDSDNQDENEGGNMEIGTRNNSVALSSEEAPTSSDSAESSTLSDANMESADFSEIDKNTDELIDKYNDFLDKNSDLFKSGHLGSDKVRLGAAGWKERYYKEKFFAETWRDIENQRKEIVKKYTEGLLWVLLYYYSEVPSWSWFYPYYYSPFASDLKGLAQVRVEFQKGSPLKPFDHLLAVLPPQSAHVLPKVYQPLLTDAESKIIDFYPTDVDIDFDGKRFMKQGIIKLPFIEEERLVSETKELEKGLQRDEALRNRNNVDQLYVSSTHNLASQILSLSPNENKVVEIDTSISDGISGFIHLPNEDTEIVYKEVHNSIEEKCVLCVSFEMRDDVVHLPHLLDGVIFPIKSITEGDITETKLWHEYQGNKPSNRLQYETCDLKHEGYQRRFSTDSSCEVIHKGAGIGWGGGRGKVNDTSNTSKHIESRERVILPSSSFAQQKSSVSSLDAGKCYGNLVSSSCNLNEQLRPHGGAQSMNDNFWLSRNGVRYGTDNVQQQRIQFGSPPTHQGRGHHGSTVSPTYSWKHSSATSSVQGRGRSQHVQHSSVEESGSH
ncbi:5'-3' exoribonuclease 3-like isoform X2 [Corylus avellana]|uniref:5'-3' exoribonuclease 3-like isoform X2 n=1 Tax=Corylus avellana TaxID=13451 RepID=UPI00286CF719|nr:5'-3' exoribonuclease 3-like isoform X2 [Corylus avellana]